MKVELINVASNPESILYMMRLLLLLLYKI